MGTSITLLVSLEAKRAVASPTITPDTTWNMSCQAERRGLFSNAAVTAISTPAKKIADSRRGTQNCLFRRVVSRLSSLYIERKIRAVQLLRKSKTAIKKGLSVLTMYSKVNAA